MPDSMAACVADQGAPVPSSENADDFAVEYRMPEAPTELALEGGLARQVQVEGTR